MFKILKLEKRGNHTCTAEFYGAKIRMTPTRRTSHLRSNLMDWQGLMQGFMRKEVTAEEGLLLG